MALQIYVTIKGMTQGTFKGSGSHKGKIPVVAFEFESISPRDPDSGQATGRRVFKPIVFAKEVDAASPQLLKALATNETLSEVDFEFSNIQPDGKELVYYTIQLTKASVAGFRQYVQVGERGGPVVDTRPLDRVSLTFERIVVTDIPGGTQYTDDWLA